MLLLAQVYGLLIELGEGPGGQRGARRLDRTIKEDEVDRSEHEHYTDALLQLGLVFAETGLPGMQSQVVSALAKFESQWLALSLEGYSS